MEFLFPVFPTPAGKKGKKPKKVIGSDGKLAELEDISPFTAKDIVRGIIGERAASENPEVALQRILFLLAILPSLQLCLVDSGSLTLFGDGTATLVSHASSFGRHLTSYRPSYPFRDNCGRHYSDHDSEWGWDSDTKPGISAHSLYALLQE